MSADERFTERPIRIVACNSKETLHKVGYTLVQAQGQTWTERAIVIRGGLILFHDGKLLTLDEGLLRRDAQEAASRLDAANDVALAGAKAVAKFVGMFCAGQGCTGQPMRRNLDDACEA